MATSGSRPPRRTSFPPANSYIASIQRFWERSYASDYVGLFVLLTALTILQLFVKPFHRMFSLDNLNIAYPHAEIERVSVIWLFIYAAVVPLATLVAWAALLQPGAHKAHVTILGLFISLILTAFITDIIKNAVGRPRPDLLSRCKPREGTPAHELVTFAICSTPSSHTLHDGWRSFPSGHSSFSFAGLGYVALVFAGQLRVFRPGHADLARCLLALAPLLGAALIAMSRLADYRHDVYDVSAGAALGTLITRAVYRRYYPALSRRGCENPYAAKGGEVANNSRRGKLRDEEEVVRGAGDYELDEWDHDDSDGDETTNERVPLAGGGMSDTGNGAGCADRNP